MTTAIAPLPGGPFRGGAGGSPRSGPSSNILARPEKMTTHPAMTPQKPIAIAVLLPGL